jgi:Kef-type K+ transport system membrane component KefB
MHRARRALRGAASARMAPTPSYIVDIALLLGTAVLAGELANRFGQAALAGQLLVGVVLGPTLLGPYIGLSSLGPELTAIQFLATVFILFAAGLEVVPEQIYRMGFPLLLFGALLFFVPFAGISGAYRLLDPGASLYTSLFVGLTLSITALPVMGIVLVEFGLLGSAIGNLLLNAALVNELVAVSVFAVLRQMSQGAGSGEVAVAIATVSVALFIATMLAIHQLLKALRSLSRWNWIRTQFSRMWRSREAGFALLMIFLFAAALYSEFLGLTFVVGAFYAGLLLTRESAGVKTHESVSSIFDAMTWGFFIPLFFAFVGLQMNLRLLGSWPIVGILVGLLVVAILTKVGTGYAYGRLAKWSRSDAAAIGFLVNSRGGVALAMAVILLTSGILNVQLFTLVAAVGFVTTIVSPIGALRAWESDPRTRAELYQRVPSLRRGVPTSSRVPAPTFEELHTKYLHEPSIPELPEAGPRAPLPGSTNVRPADPPSLPPAPDSDPPGAGTGRRRPPLPERPPEE